MPIFDFMCTGCSGHDERLFFPGEEIEEQKCEECGNIMYKLPPLSNFKLVYNNKTDMCDWDGNRSKYWDSYKAQKAAGKDVRIPEEDGETR